MDNRNNTIAGWVLGAAAFALGASLLSAEMFHAGKPEKQGYPIEGVEPEPGEGGAAAEPPITALLATADPAKGAGIFGKCTGCHEIAKGGANKAGPNLWGTVGAPLAHVAGFAYSPALKEKGGNWGWEELSQWLKSPQGFVKGTKMSFAGLGKAEDRANLIAYMNTQSDSPLPLPTAPAAAPAAADAKAAAEKADAPAAGATTEKEPVLNETTATPNRVGGDGAPAVTGRHDQTKGH